MMPATVPGARLRLAITPLVARRSVVVVLSVLPKAPMTAAVAVKLVLAAESNLVLLSLSEPSVWNSMPMSLSDLANLMLRHHRGAGIMRRMLTRFADPYRAEI